MRLALSRLAPSAPPCCAGRGLSRYPASRYPIPRVLAVWLWLALATGCSTFRLGTSTAEPADKPAKAPLLAAPSKHPYRVSQFVFLADFEVKTDQPLFRELGDLPDQVFKELQLPPSNTVIQVYLFEDREKYERFMQARYPELPRRRAFFVAQPRSVGGGEDLLVYTFWGERIREDLRHELTHALLHSVLKDVPLWLDEGLAEYFELPPESEGINQGHLEQLRRNGGETFKASLTHLEELSQVQQMTPAEYREAWAWVHLMLHGRPEVKAVLTGYLQQLRFNPSPGNLRPRLASVLPEFNDALYQHLAELAKKSSSVPTAQR